MSPTIALKNVTKQFQDGQNRLLVLEHISLAIEAGEFFVVLGPSGSGKSTLLRIMSGLELAHEGEVTLGP
ncbi:MAG: ATP-binding cassette domain-containing protein, partial [bacterium]|nr:ATP-binding cassette domain-containing protein [bacterium]